MDHRLTARITTPIRWGAPICRLWLILLVVPLFAGSAFAQARPKRLILTDGTYQVATKWEVKGDRVRYYSAERFMWEDLPASLVDWKATEKYEAEVVAGERNAARAEADAERKLEEAVSPTVAEGIRLPEHGGVYLLETFTGKAQLVELVQNGSEINKQTGGNILRSVINPIPMGVKQTIELKSKRARVQSHTGQPEIYANVKYEDDPQAASTMRPDEHFRVVRVQVKAKENRRVVGNLKIALTGSTKEQRDVIPVRISNFTTEWLKITPVQPLPPGEYALIEMLTPTEMNLFVWDFGVDPNAAENAHFWKPAAPKLLPAGTDETPVLTERQKNPSR